MNKLAKLFPVLALVLGVGFAVATAAPKPGYVAKKMALTEEGDWVDVTTQQQGTHYRCATSPEICTQVFNDGIPDPTTIVRGDYQPL